MSDMSGIKVIKQYIKDLSIENPDSIKFFGQEEERSISIDYNIKAKHYSTNNYEVSFFTHLSMKNKEGEKIYLLEMVYAGLFNITKYVKEKEDMKRILFKDCPEILFPFVRHLIADYTSGSGIKAIMLDLIDFEQLYKKGVDKGDQSNQSDDNKIDNN